MKAKYKILYFLQEIFIVVIGVIIAVSIGNLKEKIDNDKYLEKTFKTIENEIRLSSVDLDTVLSKHLKLYQELEIEYNTEVPQQLGEFILNSGGIQVASIQNVSLRFFISNKAELVEFDLISKLLEIEFQSELLADKYKRLVDFAYEHINDSSKETIIKFGFILGDVIDAEQSLLESYSNILKENQLFE